MFKKNGCVKVVVLIAIFYFSFCNEKSLDINEMKNGEYHEPIIDCK